MEYLRQIDEDLRNLCAEGGKKYPEIVDSSEKAIVAVRSIREIYISDIRNKSLPNSSVRFPRSSDIVSPYILACNYSEGSQKLISQSLNGFLLLLKYDVIPPSDAQNILRVLHIQVLSSKCELQLKILQVVVQLATLLCEDCNNRAYFSEQTIISMLTISLVLNDSKQLVSVTTAALGTAQQIIQLTMEQISTSIKNSSFEDVSIAGENQWGVRIISLICRELCSFIQGEHGVLIKLPTTCMGLQSFALDSIVEIVSKWSTLFKTCLPLSELIYSTILPSLHSILKSLHSDFHLLLIRNGLTTATSYVTRVMTLVRIMLMDYWTIERSNDFETIFMLLFYVLQPVRDIDDRDNMKSRSMKTANGEENNSFRNKVEEVSTSFMSKFPFSSAITNVISRPNFTNSNKQSSSADAEAYLLMGKSSPPTSSSFLFQSTPSNDSYVALHIAGCCIESIYSFVFSCHEKLLNGVEGFQTMINLLSNLAINASLLITIIANNDPTFRCDSDLSGIESSFAKAFITLSHEDLDLRMKSEVHFIHNLVVSSNGLKSIDVFLICGQTLSYIVKLLMKIALLLRPIDGLNLHQTLSPRKEVVVRHAFFPESLVNLVDLVHESMDSVTKDIFDDSNSLDILKNQCENIYEYVLDACCQITRVVGHPNLINIAVTATAQLGLLTGITGLTKACEIVLSSLSKIALPSFDRTSLRDGVDSRISHQPHYSTSNKSVQPIFQFKQILAMVKLLQIIHVMADLITDWDCIADCLEQFTAIYYSNVRDGSSINKKWFSDCQDKLVHFLNVESIIHSIESFGQYTKYISNESLVKLMTSFVALSMNNLSFNAECSHTPPPTILYDISQIRQVDEDYLSKSIRAGGISFSLKTVIEVTKINAPRISVIWQMVTSHLRMLASLRNESYRSLCIVATFDVIFSAVDEAPRSFEDGVQKVTLSTPTKQLPSSTSDSESISFNGFIHDELLLGLLFPSIDSLFVTYGNNLKRGSPDVHYELSFSQSDILSCLKSLVLVQYVDVRVNILQGLLFFLQESGQQLKHDVSGGWKVILDLLSSVPLSLTDESFQLEWVRKKRSGSHVFSSSKDIGDSEEHQLTSHDGFMMIGNSPMSDKELLGYYSSNHWPKETLHDAFKCLKLIVDEFVEHIINYSLLLECLIDCLSIFGSQQHDMNIALTAVEILWKVSDSAIRSSTQMNGSNKNVTDYRINDVFDIMLSRLMILSADSRPEIRHCAINTFFTAVSSNALKLNYIQWKEVFQNIIFPLFGKAGYRSVFAKRSNEEAVTGELKKGVKISMHHSRDSALKQWSETRVLILRGVLRLLKSCTRWLLSEEWFSSIWKGCIELCCDAIVGGFYELEVSLVGVDLYFGLLSIITELSFSEEDLQAVLGSNIYNAKGNGAKSVFEFVQKHRQQLWHDTFASLTEIILSSFYQRDVILSIASKLTKFYQSRKDFEFRYNQNVAILLFGIVTLCRPLTGISTISNVFPKTVNSRTIDLNDQMFRKAIIELLLVINILDSSILELFISTLAEIVFGISTIEIIVEITPNSATENLKFISELRRQQLFSLFEKEYVDVTNPTKIALWFDPVPALLRQDIVKLLNSINLRRVQLGNSQVEKPKDEKVDLFELRNIPSNLLNAPVVYTTVLKRFMIDICTPSIQKKATILEKSYQSSVKAFNGRSFVPARLASAGKSSLTYGFSDNTLQWGVFHRNEDEYIILIYAMKQYITLIENHGNKYSVRGDACDGNSESFLEYFNVMKTNLVCLLSPWKSSELIIHGNQSSNVKTVCAVKSDDDFFSELLGILFTFLCCTSVPISTKVELLDCLVLCSIQSLIILEVCYENSQPLQNSIFTVLLNNKDFFGTMMSSKDQPVMLQKGALRGLFCICRQLCNIVLDQQTRGCSGLFCDKLMDMCFSYIDILLGIEVECPMGWTADILAFEHSVFKNNAIDIVSITHRRYARTVSTVDEIFLNLVMFRHNGDEQLGGNLVPLDIDRKFHLTMLYHHAVDMLCISANQLMREKATKIIKSIDIEMMMKSIVDLIAENRKIRTDLDQTTIELQNVRSASAFPF